MSDDRALRGVAVYNPRLLSRRELVGDFVVRTSVLARVCDDLRQADHGHRPAHRIILGQRGMGKTTLLHRLRYAVEDDPSFGARWIPLVFPEEQYNVDRLSTFWLNCLDALSDAIEVRGEDPGPLDAAIEALPPLEEGTRAERALRLLLDEASSRDARLLLLVDNIDLILGRLKDQEWALREALSHEDRLLVIGASARAIESTFTFDAAFYDFFEVEELSGLTQDETHTLLTHLASRSGHPDVAELVRTRPERVEPLRVLAGGNPRTLALLFTILAQDADGDVRSDLEQLLDRCTPLYKARFEQLSPQAQKVVHELAVYWHPIGSAALAELCDLPARTVSGQLERLYKDGVIQKVQLGTDAGASTKTGYQVAERFFNIWYLMRGSRRVRRELMWLVAFLRLMHTRHEWRDDRRRGDHAETLTLALRAELQAPHDPEIAQTVACCLLADGRWHEAARRLPTFANAPDAFHDAHWADTIYFFRLAVQKGHTSHALAAIDQLGLADRWLPLRTALQVLAVGDRGVLLSVAPEVRQPTEMILSQLAECLPTAAPTTRGFAVGSLPRAKSGDSG